MKKPKPAKSPISYQLHALRLKHLLSGMRKLVFRYLRLISLIGGSIILLIWTYLRHITNGVNFDTIGQIGLAQQWAFGQISGAQVGVTNYLLKTPFYLAVNLQNSISPMNRILLLAAIFNIVTFVLIFLISEKFLKLYSVKDRTWLYIGLLWLATISGGVYWLDTANSRNLEVVGGLLLIYLALKYIKNRGRPILALICITSGLVFFADSLMLYVCALGIIIYLLGRLIMMRTKKEAETGATLIFALLVGYLIAHSLFFIANKYLAVSFINAPRSADHLNLNLAIGTIKATFYNTLNVFDANFLQGPLRLRSLQEFLNAIVLLGLAGFLISKTAKLGRFRANIMIAVIILINFLIFALSGQALAWETSRYLIMVPILIILMFALNADLIPKKHIVKIQNIWLVFILMSSLMLLGALIVSLPNKHDKDKHIFTLLTFLHDQHFSYALSSREIGVTSTYFAQGKITVLPMSCDSGKVLAPTNLFYDNAAFSGLHDYAGEVPIIVPANGITFGQYSCSSRDIIKQFGPPLRITDIPGLGVALIYDSTSLRSSALDSLAAHSRSSNPATIKKIAAESTLAKLQGCDRGSIDVIVAHPDDDILFMNPDLESQMKAGKCVRTTYLTAGDDGRDSSYWLRREQGIEAAYATMLDSPNVWLESPAIVDGHTVMVNTLEGQPSISLVFVRLPDGGVDGKGFHVSQHSSLESASTDTKLILSSVDQVSSYSYLQILRLIQTILYIDKPYAIFTTIPSGQYSVGDHSDHAAAGRLTLQAAKTIKSKANLSEYIGYPSNDLQPNLNFETMSHKRDIFYTYASDDYLVCGTGESCTIEDTYGKYFSRRYKIDPTGPRQERFVPLNKPNNQKNKTQKSVIDILTKQRK